MEHKDFLVAVTKQWQARAKGQMLRPNTAGYKTRQLEFFMGAYVAGEMLGCKLNEMTLVMLSVGRDSVYEFLDRPAAEAKAKAKELEL